MSNLSDWVEVAMVGQCPPGSAMEVICDDRVVALYHIGDEYFALDGVCPHQGGPLGSGKLEGCLVTCPWHGWQFDVRTGESQTNKKLVQPGYPVRIDGNRILIQLV